MFRAALGLWLAVASFAAAACEFADGGAKAGEVSSKSYTVAYRFEPEQPELTSVFAVRAKVCAKGGSDFAGSLSANADMPHHGHGMNYKPRISKEGNAEFLAEGFVLHMPGHWRYVFKIVDGEKRETLTFEQHAK